ncbi:MAG: hypothetical protein HPY71_06705 [Firmicutes bacterium]|nr:hypothetical protein [Bacillota bacterium]
MPERPPSLKEWQELYDAAIKFKDLAPWEWMYDSDIFGVKNPYSDDEIGYCCVLGRAGEVLGLVVYLGSEGLQTYIETQLGRAQKNPFATFIETTGLVCFFGSRDELHKRDLEVIKGLGLRFRGHNAWPMFRSYRPGYYPWFLTSGESRYLAIALEQSLNVATRFREDPEMLKPPKPGQYLVRVPLKQDGKILWTDSWIEPKPVAKVEVPRAVYLDSIRIRRALKGAKKVSLHVEADLFNLPNPIMDEGDERPYFPRMVLWVDKGSGLVLKFDLFDLEEQDPFGESFLRFIETTGMIPSDVHLADRDREAELTPVADAIGTRLVREKRLRALEQAREGLLATMGAGW